MAFVLLVGLDRTVFDEGWERWRGVGELVVSVTYWLALWIEDSRRRKKDSAT